MSLPVETVSPKAVPEPPPPATDPLTEAQWRTFFAITDTIVPCIKPKAVATPSEAPASDNDYSTAIATFEGRSEMSSREVATAFLHESASSIPEFRTNMQRMFSRYMPQDQLKQLLMVLNILDTRAGSLLLTGYTTPISQQPVRIRTEILQSWSTAHLPILRGLFGSLTMLTKMQWMRTSPTLRQVIGIPRVPMNMIPGKGFDYGFLQFPQGAKPEIIETDVVIVGSGCGGGVCARNLAEAGHKVLVVDSGYHWTPDHFPMTERQGMDNLFMNGGVISSDDNTMSILCGSTWGGGGTINWAASLQTQGYVRREWAATGLPFFTSADFQTSLDRVCERMGVSDKYIHQNNTNQKLLDGARKLGWTHKAVPQNTGGKQHSCGFCNFGCGSCEKQGPVVSFLPDAARAGATFVEGFQAERVVFKTRKGVKVAVGVKGTWTSRDANGGVSGPGIYKRKVFIKAKRVIVSGGTMQSPLLLLRSGLKNHHIGRNLYTHPVSVLGAIHPDDIKPWEGSILTSVISEYENLDGKGHGVKLEATNMVPSLWLTFLPWKNGLEYKKDVSRFKNMAGYISLARDTDSGTGRVYPDPTDGRVRFQYTVSKTDRRHITEGLVALAKTQYVTGAEELFTLMGSVPPFKRSVSATPASNTGEVIEDAGINDPAFNVWLDKVRAAALPAPDTVFASAHQMGTCRMSATAKKGVVDPHGQVWGTKGLYVADASVFPSASGVNPMVTNMAISDWISRGISKGLAKEAGRAKL